MRRSMSVAALAAGVGLLLGAQDAAAQGGMPPGGMPSREEIRERIEGAVAQLVERAPEAEVELEGICKIKYKQIPTNPQEVAELLGQQMGGGAPAGVDVDQYIKMFERDITEILNQHLAQLGTIEALVPLKDRSKDIPVGKWRFGLAFEGERPAALVVWIKEDPEDEEAEFEPVPLRLKTRSVDIQDRLVIGFVEPKRQKKGKEEFALEVTFLRFQARTREVERDG